MIWVYLQEFNLFRLKNYLILQIQMKYRQPKYNLNWLSHFQTVPYNFRLILRNVFLISAKNMRQQQMTFISLYSSLHIHIHIHRSPLCFPRPSFIFYFRRCFVISSFFFLKVSTFIYIILLLLAFLQFVPICCFPIILEHIINMLKINLKHLLTKISAD